MAVEDNKNNVLNPSFPNVISPVKPVGAKENEVEIQDFSRLVDDTDVTHFVTLANDGVSKLLPYSIIKNMIDYNKSLVEYNEKMIQWVERQALKAIIESGSNGIPFSGRAKDLLEFGDRYRKDFTSIFVPYQQNQTKTDVYTIPANEANGVECKILVDYKVVNWSQEITITCQNSTHDINLPDGLVVIANARISQSSNFTVYYKRQDGVIYLIKSGDDDYTITQGENYHSMNGFLLKSGDSVLIRNQRVDFVFNAERMVKGVIIPSIQTALPTNNAFLEDKPVKPTPPTL